MGPRKVRVRYASDNPDLLARLDEFLGEEELVNVTLVCDRGLKLKAHKLVLSACSSVFQDIFVSNPCAHPVVILKGVPYEDLAAFIDIVYRREATVPLERLESFLSTASMFKVNIVIEISGDDTGEVAQIVRGESSGSSCASPAERELHRGHSIVWVGQPQGDCGCSDARGAIVLEEKIVNAKKSEIKDGSSVDKAIKITDASDLSGASASCMLSTCAFLNEHYDSIAEATGAPSASESVCGPSGHADEEGNNVSRVADHWKVEPAGTEGVFMSTFLLSQNEQLQSKDAVDDPLLPGTDASGPVIVSTAPCLTWYDDDEETSPAVTQLTDGASPNDCAVSDASTSVMPVVAGPSKFRPDNAGTESETVQSVHGHAPRRNDSRVKTETMGRDRPPPRANASQSLRCAVCSMAFATASCLRRHEAAHFQSNQHPCPHCNTVFSHKDHLEHHVLVHTAAEPYRCKHCSLSFVQKTGLKRHMITCTKKLQRHQRNSSPVDTVERAAGKGKKVAKLHNSKRLSAAQRGDLEQHVLAPVTSSRLRRPESTAPALKGKVKVKSSSKKLFQCSRCEASFARKGNLENHEIVHISGAPFCCRYCPAAYHRKFFLDRHMFKCPKKAQ